MYVLSLLKKTAQPTEYYFNDEATAKAIVEDLKSEDGTAIFSDDYGHTAIVRRSEIVEATAIDCEKRKLAVHECKMVSDYANFKIQKSTMDDPRTSEIMKSQQPVSDSANLN